MVPTRARAQALWRRLEPGLHDRLGLRLGLRTGDVKRLLAGTAAVLLTTPESLAVMRGSPHREGRDLLYRAHWQAFDPVSPRVSVRRGCRSVARGPRARPGKRSAWVCEAPAGGGPGGTA